MLFNSYPFIFAFLPFVLAGFFIIGRYFPQTASLWLAAASLFFYSWWNPRFVLLLLVSIGFNYSAGAVIGRARGRRAAAAALGIVVTLNLGLLAVYKYANFFLATANGLGAHFQPWEIVLPLGISFFTFTQIAFVVDVYRGLAREYNLAHYLLFVTWFPHLIAGPLLHHKQMMPQFSLPSTYRPDLESMSVGFTLFTIGMFKKVLIADHLATVANPVFDRASLGDHPGAFQAWSGVLAYSLQLYFDFSGYSDMAIGLSRLFNIRLPANFNSPYKAVSAVDFWRRWHMTLSTFLRDYLYIPLGGNRMGPARRYLNLFATMLLGGLWHGAGWNFVIWGGLHGLYLIVNHIWRKGAGKQRWLLPLFAGTRGAAITFVAVIVAWVPFRADSFAATKALLVGMSGYNGLLLPEQLHLLSTRLFHHEWQFDPAPLHMRWGLILIGLALVWFFPNSQEWLSHYHPVLDDVPDRSAIAWRPSWGNAVLVGSILGVTLISLNSPSIFLYFQF